MSEMGFFLMFEVYASIACTMASMPVIAVMLAGSPMVNAASRMATSGKRTGELTPALVVSPVVIIATGVTSEPVPAVVGAKNNGFLGLETMPTP